MTRAESGKSNRNMTYQKSILQSCELRCAALRCRHTFKGRTWAEWAFLHDDGDLDAGSGVHRA